MIVLGIVGSIAGGKSTVARHLQELSAVWIDADSLAKEALDLIEVQNRLVGHFGNQILDSSGRVDRPKLGSIVFGKDQASREELGYLESVVHPVVRDHILQALKRNSQEGVLVSLLDVPLLFESGWDRTCDQIWCIDAEPELRAVRAATRGWQPDEIIKREQRQLPMQVKIQLSNTIIQNNGSLEQLHQTIDQHWQRITRVNLDPTPDKHCQ